jgi:chymotrypsin
MKLIVALIFIVFTISALAEDNWKNINYDEVVPLDEIPGFWDGRDIRPAVNQTRSRRIVGGHIVTPGAHPYQVVVLLLFPATGTAICSGTLISGNRILTTTSCLTGSTEAQAILGAHRWTSGEASQQRRFVDRTDYRLHQQYNPSNFNNDIAIFILRIAVLLTDRIQNSNLPGSSASSFAGEIGTVSGWGRTSDQSSDQSHELRSTTNPIITNAVCAEHQGAARVISSTICMSTFGGRGPCRG